MKATSLRVRRAPVMVGLALLLLALLAGCTLGGGGGSGGSSGGPVTTGDLQISFSTDPSPPRAGPVQLIVALQDSAGAPVDGATVTIAADMTAMSHGGMSGAMEAQGGGKYGARGSFTMPGGWRADVTVARDGEPAQRASFELAVGR